MVTVITEVIIHSDELLFMPGGDVWEWCEGVADELKTTARAYCPPNRTRSRWGHRASGKTLASIKAGVTPSGPERLTITLSVDSEGALYCLPGTAYQGMRYIYSDGGYANRQLIARIYRRGGQHEHPMQWKESRKGLYMRLPPGPGSSLQLRVRGQRSNPFLSDAYNSVRYHHSALPEIRGLPTTSSTGW